MKEIILCNKLRYRIGLFSFVKLPKKIVYERQDYILQVIFYPNGPTAYYVCLDKDKYNKNLFMVSAKSLKKVFRMMKKEIDERVVNIKTIKR